ncbi:WxL domain-containing protein [Vagococcus salmoninarum]|uniref:WxL domain-containing protein n=1 Tax=Vagococcus salmoninarum TaxID=2739 RepID=UPI00187E3FDE|nr:WxL domain-containing protein [Vagococcus salmoninarum]MBE9387596.1 WxL domain-containing protein [Vagococcus salmoninarum]
MKKTRKMIISFSLLVCLSALSDATETQADTKKAETKGSVSFERNDNQEGGNPTEPGGTDPLNPQDPGGNTNGALRIEYVPNIQFGTQKISLEDKLYNSKWNLGKLSEAKSRIIPHMIQVTDERGSTEDFKVTVTGTTFKDAEGGNELKNTRLQFTGQTLINSNEAVATDILTGFQFDPEHKVVINDKESVVISTLADKTADGSKSYNVFSNNYEHEAFFGNQTTLPKDNEGIQLFSPGTDVKKDSVAYEATLTWTLGSEL